MVISGLASWFDLVDLAIPWLVPTTAIVSCSKQHMWGTRQKYRKRVCRERKDLTENGNSVPRTGGLCLERVVFCRERVIRFPGVVGPTHVIFLNLNRRLQVKWSKPRSIVCSGRVWARNRQWIASTCGVLSMIVSRTFFEDEYYYRPSDEMWN